jgi:hypothetical protein
MPRLFTYLMTHDSGFAPNPFHGTLTLATCKPGIRKTKDVGDWIAGFASQTLVNKSKAIGVNIKLNGLVYLMQVSKVMPLEEYFESPHFQSKKPSPEINKSRNLKEDYGDNIYSRDEAGIFHWWPNGNHDQNYTQDDTEGKNVLIADNFYYFGRECPIPETGWRNSVRIPDGLPTYYGYENDEVALNNILYFLQSKNYRPGVHGTPCLWEENRKESHRIGHCS